MLFLCSDNAFMAASVNCCQPILACDAALWQKTLYVPAQLLREGDNEIVVFESDGYEIPEVMFTDIPVLHG